MSLDRHQREPRKRISPTDRVPLRLSDRKRTLIIDKTLAPDDLTCHLRLAAVGEKRPPVALTLDEWEELQGYVAAEANHCDVKKLERELDRIFDQIQGILDSYTDQD